MIITFRDCQKAGNIFSVNRALYLCAMLPSRERVYVRVHSYHEGERVPYNKLVIEHFNEAVMYKIVKENDLYSSDDTPSFEPDGAGLWLCHVGDYRMFAIDGIPGIYYRESCTCKPTCGCHPLTHINWEKGEVELSEPPPPKTVVQPLALRWLHK